MCYDGLIAELHRQNCMTPLSSVSPRVCRKASKYTLSSADERYPASIPKQRGNHPRKSYDASLKLNETESLKLEGGNHYSFPLQ